ncbi:dihydrofolate reductase family protein [Taibaiella chishuiensis]|uniref:Dihydrofolate reductase n=1 Tax=Taibaiella chishuiensis TaxID=1434707 RepID=A0A2P8D891_9BACT|nr:dihydrofolate reductase family protein [Taibaiella chishuiensis]PSK93401.1 dihydrofolate reductase [Taibaiella chishuiensis]
MRKLVLCMHTSLDNFVAGPGGAMDWIHVDEEIFKYTGKLTEAADTALYGRVTYQMMEGYWPTAGDQPNASDHDKDHSRWYNHVKKVVLSHTLQSQDPNLQIVSDNLAAQIRQLKQESGKNILIFGSASASHALMEAQLIDEFWLFVNPVILGTGIPLFKDTTGKVPLDLLSVVPFASGVVGLHYQKRA